MDPQLFDIPIVERPVVLKLQGADGMRDSLNGVGLAMGPIVGGVNAPLVSCAWMGHMQDAVHNGIPHVQIARSHIDLGSQHTGPVRKFSRSHSLKEVQILSERFSDCN